jgi:hypothetical protein
VKSGSSRPIALENYVNLHHDWDPHLSFARRDLRDAVNAIDWPAIDFAVDARQRGEDLYSCAPDSVVLVRYQAPRQCDHRQARSETSSMLSTTEDYEDFPF